MLLLAAIVLSLPIFYFGVPDGNDMPQHLRFIYAFYNSVHNGEIYPVWPGETNLGFGDVGIRFYPPLAYYVVVLFRSLTESWASAYAAAICFWFFVGGIGVFFLAREWFSVKASLAAALLFMAMPYHANQVYNAGLFAEFTGLAILPFCFLFVGRTINYGKVSDVAGLAAAYALLILAHLPLTIIGSIGLVIYAIAAIEKRGAGRSLIKLASAVVLALTTSAFYWVRIVAELSFVKHSSPEFRGGAYDFRQNFLASILYMPSSEYGETSLWYTDLLFAITLMMIVPSIAIYLATKKSESKNLAPFLVLLALAIVISTPLSLPLWENIEFLKMIQFPWRFLGLISLAGSLVIGGSYDQLAAVFQTKLRPLGLIAAGLLIAGVVFTGTQVIRPANHSPRVAFDENFERYGNDESYECWWPIWANKNAFVDREQVSSGQRFVQILKWTADDRRFVVGEGSSKTVRVATFYYPFWKADADGSNARVEPGEDGTVLIDVPPGRSTVRLYFEEPVHETIARYLSLLVWALLAFTVIAVRVNAHRHSNLD